jgi:ABC-type metal ion transport system substrate-binding protein
MQHPVYLKSVNERLGIDNVGIVQVPTPPMGLYGGKIKTLGTPAAGTVVSVPNQPPNEYRAVLVLESLGWVKLNQTAIRPPSRSAISSKIRTKLCSKRWIMPSRFARCRTSIMV